jgi:hypothetical protein
VKPRYATLLDFIGLDAPPVAKGVRKRRAPRVSHEPKTRWPGHGFLTQLRWPLPGNLSVHCGLFDPAFVVVVRDRLAREVAKHPATELGVWFALQTVFAALREEGIETPTVLPKFVKAYPDGRYFAEVKKAGRTLECPGPFDRPEAAHLAMLDLLARECATRSRQSRGQRSLLDEFEESPAATDRHPVAPDSGECQNPNNPEYCT